MCYSARKSTGMEGGTYLFPLGMCQTQNSDSEYRKSGISEYLKLRQCHHDLKGLRGSKLSEEKTRPNFLSKQPSLFSVGINGNPNYSEYLNV